MNFIERRELKQLITELKRVNDNEILQKATDFEIVQALLQCAIINLKKIVRE